MSIPHKFWTEKYRPKTVDECILPDALKETLKGYLKDGGLNNLLFTGSAGVGKTTVARAMGEQLGYEVMVINGSLEGRLIDTLRTRIQDFASTVSMDDSQKLCIIDEADGLSADVQKGLRNFTENFSANCAFMFTCNFVNQVIDPLRSRCAVVTFDIPKSDKVKLAGQFLKRAEEILKAENVPYDKKAVAEVIMKFYPDWRRVLNELQRFSKTGKIDEIAVKNFGESSIKELVGFLKGKEFKAMRQWVATAPSLELPGLCRSLYEQADAIVEAESIPMLVLIIAKYQYQHAFVADAEINIVAMLTEIMAELKWK